MIRHVVYLVQKGLISNQVVSGKSGKNYGTAVPVHARGGVVLKMTMEEYTAAAQDIVGNTAPNQQWVPDIVPEAEAAPGRGKCGIPSGCKAGPGGNKADAEFIWETHLFCRAHAPNNATPIDENVVPLSEQPAAPAPKDDPEPVAPIEQPAVLPPPAVGEPEPSAPKVFTHEGIEFELLEGAVRVGKTKLSTSLLETLGNNDPNPDLWFRILKREGDGLLLLESKKFEPVTEDAFKDYVHQRLDAAGVPKEFPDGQHTKEGCRIGDRLDWVLERIGPANDEPPQVENDGLDTMPWQQLQKLAKKRGMNIFRQGREALVKWVREHPDKSSA